MEDTQKQRVKRQEISSKDFDAKIKDLVKNFNTIVSLTEKISPLPRGKKLEVSVDDKEEPKVDIQIGRSELRALKTEFTSKMRDLVLDFNTSVKVASKRKKKSKNTGENKGEPKLNNFSYPGFFEAEIGRFFAEWLEENVDTTKSGDIRPLLKLLKTEFVYRGKDSDGELVDKKVILCSYQIFTYLFTFYGSSLGDDKQRTVVKGERGNKVKVFHVGDKMRVGLKKVFFERINEKGQKVPAILDYEMVSYPDFQSITKQYKVILLERPKQTTSDEDRVDFQEHLDKVLAGEEKAKLLGTRKAEVLRSSR